MLNTLLAGLAILVVLGIVVVIFRAMIRIVGALPQAIVGGVLGLAGSLFLGADPGLLGGAGALIGLAHGMRANARRELKVTVTPSFAGSPPAPRSAPDDAAPSVPLPERAPTPPAVDPEPPRDPRLARAWVRAMEAVPARRPRLMAARAGCDLLLDLVDDGGGDAVAAEWADMIRARAPEIVDRALALFAHLAPGEREGAGEAMTRALEAVGDEAAARREAVGQAARDAFELIRRHVDVRTGRDPLGTGRT